MTCLAILTMTAAMVIDADTARGPFANVRLTGPGNAPFDAPETWRPKCRSEAKRGALAAALVRSAMPGKLCIIARGTGGYGRDLGVLYGSDGRQVGDMLIARGLAQPVMKAEWCGAGG